MKFTFAASLLVFLASSSFGFSPAIVPGRNNGLASSARLPSQLHMDPVTYLRTEWVSAALCTNQTPRSADVCLQIGTQDGRAVTFVPRTIRELVTSSIETDGNLSVSIRRQLKQQQERRGAATVTYVDQRADDLSETEDESVDVVISLLAVGPMTEKGLDWKKSVQEAARVLKPGGRLLFVEQADVNGDSYLKYVQDLYSLAGANEEDAKNNGEVYPVFEEVGSDEVDLVLEPHIAGVAIKSIDAGLTTEERAKKEANAEKDRLADLSIEAYERGIKKGKKRKKKKKQGQEEETAAKA